MMPANEAGTHQRLLIKCLIKTHRHCLVAHRIDQLDFDGRFGFAPLELFDEGRSAASLWRLSARVTGMDLVYAGIPAGLALLLLIGFAVSGRIFNPNDNVRRVFSAVLAVTLLLTIGLVYADIFVFSGEIFERGLAIWRLDIFYQERFAYTLAFAGGIVHPILFIIAGVGLLCLPSPKDGFSMR